MAERESANADMESSSIQILAASVQERGAAVSYLKSRKRRGRITDKQRLDWLQENNAAICPVGDGRIVLGVASGADIHNSLRRAIDAAIKREARGSDEK